MEALGPYSETSLLLDTSSDDDVAATAAEHRYGRPLQKSSEVHGLLLATSNMAAGFRLLIVSHL